MSQPSNTTSFVSEYIVPRFSVEQRLATMLLLMILAVPSLICFLIIFYYFIRLRKTLLFDRMNHHVILCILISDFLLIFTELPFTLLYLGYGYLTTSKPCLFWIFWDYSLEVASLFLTMYASIERYALVFHHQWIMKHKCLLHYIPLGFFALYSFIIYAYLVFVVPCKSNHTYDLTSFACGGACYYDSVIQNTYDTIVNIMLPSLVLFILNCFMIGTVVSRKRRISPSTPIAQNLKRNRRMILQLLAISLMTLITWIPWVILILGQNFCDPSFGQKFMDVAAHYLPYFTSFASPFLALIGLPEIYKKLQKFNIQVPVTLWMMELHNG